MSKLITFFLLLVSFIISGNQLAIAGDQKQGQILGISKSLEQFPPHWWKESFLEIGDDASEAWEEGKHLIIFFHLENCPYCNKMAYENFNDSPYIDFLKDNFDVVLMNVNGSLEVTMTDGEIVTEKEFADRLQVYATPGLLFFNGDGEQVLHLGGYRPHKQFEPVLQYVASRSYEEEALGDYLAKHRKQQSADYSFIDNAAFIDTDDLSQLPDKPTMIIFEDATCGASCTHFHEKFLANNDVKQLLDMMNVVRWDAVSEKPVRDHRGKKTTVKAFVAEQQIVYRPGVLLIDKGKVLARRNSYVVLHHFLGGLEFVATRAYLTQSRRAFSATRERMILDSGQDIDLRI